MEAIAFSYTLKTVKRKYISESLRSKSENYFIDFES